MRAMKTDKASDSRFSSGPPRAQPTTVPSVALAEPPGEPATQSEVRAMAHQLLQGLASLRLTVVLFALSLLLVFWGTWAQVDAGVWTVVNKYFRTGLVLVPLRTILFNIPAPDSALGQFTLPYPGGWLLGGLLLANVIAAHLVRFKLAWKRSGILLIHSGIIVMMLGELFTGLFANEGRMTIIEKTSVNWVDHDKDIELAFVRRDADKDHEVVIPHAFLAKGGLIQDTRLPVDVKVHSFMKNAHLEKYNPTAHPDNPATTGIGLAQVAREVPEVSGVGEQKIDLPTAYVELLDKASGKSLGTYLVSTWYAFMQRPADTVTVDGVDWQVQLRAKREYRPFSVFLARFKHDKFTGTDTPKNYQSDVIVSDPERGEKREVKIWMNHPLYYRGETFYQSSLHPLTKGTVLQVVRNPGWALPYIACGMVSGGMLVHFSLHLREFLRRRLAS
jgi:hypothetical protein